MLGYEPRGRGFESCRARHKIKGLQRCNPFSLATGNALGYPAATEPVDSAGNKIHFYDHEPRAPADIEARAREGAMTDPAWLANVGAAAGVVGIVSGVAGMVVGIASYRRVSRMKALDLRLELRKESTAARALIESLPALIDRRPIPDVCGAVAQSRPDCGGQEMDCGDW
jgi:hypothetical protein